MESANAAVNVPIVQDQFAVRAAIGYRMTGDAEGTAYSDVAMYYRPDGTAWVAGLWTVTAAVGDRSGRCHATCAAS